MKYYYFHSAHKNKNCCSWEMSVIVFSLLRAVLYLSVCSSQYWHACRFCFCSISDGEKLWWHHYRNYRRSSYKPFNPPLSARPVSGADYNQAWPGLWWTGTLYKYWITNCRVCLAESSSGLVNCWKFLVQVVIDWAGGSIRTINTWISWQFWWQQGHWGDWDLWCQLIIILISWYQHNHQILQLQLLHHHFRLNCRMVVFWW